MKFKSLQENLRKALWERIDEGELTGLRLATQTGFRQAHISNFLNRKRSLSLEGMDRVLSVQHLSVLDLLDPAEVNKRATIAPPSDDAFENIFVVEAGIAASQPLIMSMNVREIQKFKRSFLRKLRPDMHGKRADWERFVAIKIDGRWNEYVSAAFPWRHRTDRPALQFPAALPQGRAEYVRRAHEGILHRPLCGVGGEEYHSEAA